MLGLARRQESRSLSIPFGSWNSFCGTREVLRWYPRRYFGSSRLWEPVAFVPSFDVKETKEGIVLEVDLPGVRHKDLSVTLTGNRLTVSGEQEAEEQEKKKDDEDSHTTERTYGSFTRAFTLPEGVNAGKVKAELKDGVLSLILPKKPEVKTRQISVKKGK